MSLVGELTQLGMLNRISTGYAMLDVLLCALLPILLKSLEDRLMRVFDALWNRPAPPPPTEFRRSIEYKIGDGCWYEDHRNKHNKILYEAIMAFMTDQRDSMDSFQEGDVRVVRKRGRNRSGCYVDDDDDHLENFEIHSMPPLNHWIEMKGDISIRREERRESKNNESYITHILELSYFGENGDVAISEFLESTFQWYEKKVKEENDPNRYLYVPLLHNGAVKPSGNQYRDDGTYLPRAMLCKRYMLSEDKTFQSFFHPCKADLLRILDQFMNRTGKFAIPGYPYKLGLLLHGPPGTGKTSLIKAMAHYTGRHVVSIPLARVGTNQQLMDLVFDQACRLEGDCNTYKIPFKDTIFVMEDVDAAGDVVLQRSTAPAKGAGLDKKEKHKKTDEKEFAKNKLKFDNANDSLNLAGLLNLLDGVVDCPGRLVIMTSNHPEKLDPALIRPGRINFQFYMGTLEHREAVEMISHYIGSMTRPEKRRLEDVIGVGVVTPAILESACAECDSVPDLLRKLENLEVVSKLLWGKRQNRKYRKEAKSEKKNRPARHREQSLELEEISKS